MTFGSKYKFKPDKNPPPGLYNTDNATKLVKPSSVMTPVFTQKVGRKVKRQASPDAGCYEPHKQFGYTHRKITFGAKYKFKPDKNPAPGQYQPSIDVTRPKTPKIDWSKGCKKERGTYLVSP